MDAQSAAYNTSRTGEVIHMIISKLKSTINALSYTIRCQLELHRPGWESLEISDILSLQVTQECIFNHVCEIMRQLQQQVDKSGSVTLSLNESRDMAEDLLNKKGVFNKKDAKNL